MNELLTQPDEPPKKPRKQKRGTPRIVRIIQWFFTTALLGFIFAAIAMALVIQHYSASLPSTDQLSNITRR